MARPEPRAESVAGGKYKLIKKIGSGSFGIIYLGTNLDNGEEVAVKVESKRTLHPQLRKESKVCKIMNGVLGYPRVRWFGEDYSWSYLVMDLLGPSLEQLFTFCSRKFTMKTVLMLAEQLLSRVEFLHRKHLIHRDIKPDNFLMGKGHRSGELYMIDFGLAKSFRYSGSLNHIESGMNNDLTGTARYASINAHRGCRQSRRDDMVSVGYMLLYFLSGSLPWQGLRAATRKQKYEKICEMKMSSAVEDMCKDYPVEFSTYLGMSSCLGYMESPSYDYSRSLFRNLFRRLSLTYDYKFDWTILKEKGVNEADISDPNTPVPATRPQIQMQQRQKPRHLPSTYNYRQKQQQQYNLQKEQQQHNQLQHQQGVQCLAIEEFQPRPNQQTLEPVEQTRGTKNSD